jgi:hypothetical protein
MSIRIQCTEYSGRCCCTCCCFFFQIPTHLRWSVWVVRRIQMLTNVRHNTHMLSHIQTTNREAESSSSSLDWCFCCWNSFNKIRVIIFRLFRFSDIWTRGVVVNHAAAYITSSRVPVYSSCPFHFKFLILYLKRTAEVAAAHISTIPCWSARTRLLFLLLFF